MRKLLAVIKQYASHVLIAECALVICLTYVRGDQLGMRNNISTQFLWYYAPIAITYLKDPTPLNYVANATRMDRLTKTYSETRDIDAAFKAAIDAPFHEPAWFIWGNDKGGALYSVLAFRLFGIVHSSHYDLFFLLLSISALLFVASYRQHPFKIFCLLCLLTSLYVLAQPFSQGGLQLGGFQAQRALPVLALVPMLHLLFAIATHRSRYGVLALALQAFLLVFVYFMRSSAAWAFIGIALFTVAVAFRQRHVILDKLKARNIQESPHSVNLYALPLVLIAGSLGLLFVYKQISLHPRYFSDLTETRVLWHNMYMGLVWRANLLKSSDFATELFPTKRWGDAGVKDALEIYLKRTDRATEWENMERAVQDGKSGNIYALAKYDQFVREMYWDAWRRFPIELLKTYLIRKPVGVVALIDELWKPTKTSHPNPDEDYFGASPLRIAALLLLIPALGLLLCLRYRPSRYELGACIALIVSPQITWFLTYPAFGMMPEAFVALTFMVYVAPCMILLGIAVKWSSRATASQPSLDNPKGESGAANDVSSTRP